MNNGFQQGRIGTEIMANAKKTWKVKYNWMDNSYYLLYGNIRSYSNYKSERLARMEAIRRNNHLKRKGA